mmetsp:Transcript_3379/g.3898  ORF Transcript_3379/g.3898 Transcript_3379/m.3898 type:complete len:206 (+) Transcript_3379:346-963(+)
MRLPSNSESLAAVWVNLQSCIAVGNTCARSFQFQEHFCTFGKHHRGDVSDLKRLGHFIQGFGQVSIFYRFSSRLLQLALFVHLIVTQFLLTGRSLRGIWFWILFQPLWIRLLGFLRFFRLFLLFFDLCRLWLGSLGLRLWFGLWLWNLSTTTRDEVLEECELWIVDKRRVLLQFLDQTFQRLHLRGLHHENDTRFCTPVRGSKIS